MARTVDGMEPANTPADQMIALIDEATRTIAAQANRIIVLESMFSPPHVVEGRYQGVRVIVNVGQPRLRDPLSYSGRWLEGPNEGAYVLMAHEMIEFIDPMRVVPESHLRGLTDRIRALEQFMDAVRTVHTDVSNATTPNALAIEHEMISGLLKALESKS